MRLAPQAPRVLNCIGLAVLCGLAPFAVAIAALVIFRDQAFLRALPTLFFGPPLSALSGLVAAGLVYRMDAARLSVGRVWLLTAAAAAVPGLGFVWSEFGSVSLAAATPLILGALLGALPPAFLARARLLAAAETQAEPPSAAAP